MKLKSIGGALTALALGLTSVQANAHDDKIKVMTRNLYLGADIFSVVAAGQNPDPLAVPVAVAEVFQTVQQTNFPERAQAIADEVQRYRPHVIGLQEVSEYRIQVPGDFLIGNPTPAETVVYDYLDILQAALAERGLNYHVAVVSDNADIELPMFAGIASDGATPLFNDLRLSDRDVILVRDGVTFSNTYAGNYTYNVQTTVGGVVAEFTRGYTLADVNVKGVDYRFVNTHLETGGSEPFKSLQAVQMNELMGVVSATSNPALPLIMVGDFNSAPTDVPFTSTSGIPGLDGLPLVPPYLQAVGTGMTDLWLERKRPKDGFTCCFDPLVSDVNAQLSERIDHIFFDRKDRIVEKLKAKLVGDDVVDMTENGLYPSDHAGVVGKIKLED